MICDTILLIVVDYCSFYSSLENLLNELIKYIE